MLWGVQQALHGEELAGLRHIPEPGHPLWLPGAPGTELGLPRPAHSWHTEVLCSLLFPLLLPLPSSLSSFLFPFPFSFLSPLPAIKVPTLLYNQLPVGRGLWINYYCDPHCAVKNFVELLSEKSKFAFK